MSVTIKKKSMRSKSRKLVAKSKKMRGGAGEPKGVKVKGLIKIFEPPSEKQPVKLRVQPPRARRGSLSTVSRIVLSPNSAANSQYVNLQQGKNPIYVNMPPVAPAGPVYASVIGRAVSQGTGPALPQKIRHVGAVYIYSQPNKIIGEEQIYTDPGIPNIPEEPIYEIGPATTTTPATATETKPAPELPPRRTNDVTKTTKGARNIFNKFKSFTNRLTNRLTRRTTQPVTPKQVPVTKNNLIRASGKMQSKIQALQGELSKIPKSNTNKSAEIKKQMNTLRNQKEKINSFRLRKNGTPNLTRNKKTLFGERSSINLILKALKNLNQAREPTLMEETLGQK